jgi:glyoxylase-like metal-dependent hydrolase (beta-lactamase superfamily II)
MKLYTIETGFFKLDGGAMFGVVPKSLWERTNPADANNLCTWAMRCLLVEDGDRLTLIDTGIGTKQDAKFFSHYHLHGDATLDRSLAAHGFHRDDITDVFLTHLHFDHVGGAVALHGDALRPAFVYAPTPPTNPSTSPN